MSKMDKVSHNTNIIISTVGVVLNSIHDSLKSLNVDLLTYR